MQHLADLLATIPLPDLPAPDGAAADGAAPRPLPRGPWSLGCDEALVQDLGADLPAGHLHVWGGPSGAGKTSFLLSLLAAAAGRGRRVAYATYDLAPQSLAFRMLAMAAHVEPDRLPDPGGSTADCSLTGEALERVHAARAALSRLPFSFLPARGFSVDSIRDRLVRMPFRAEVLAVDYLQGVIREPGMDMGAALRGLSDLADTLHVAVVCAVRPQGRGQATAVSTEDLVGVSSAPDRIGWLGTGQEDGAETSRTASVVLNRHGERTVMPLSMDQLTGALDRMPSDDASSADAPTSGASASPGPVSRT